MLSTEIPCTLVLPCNAAEITSEFVRAQSVRPRRVVRSRPSARPFATLSVSMKINLRSAAPPVVSTSSSSSSSSVPSSPLRLTSSSSLPPSCHVAWRRWKGARLSITSATKAPPNEGSIVAYAHPFIRPLLHNAACRSSSLATLSSLPQPQSNRRAASLILTFLARHTCIPVLDPLNVSQSVIHAIYYTLTPCCRRPPLLISILRSRKLVDNQIMFLFAFGFCLNN